MNTQNPNRVVPKGRCQPPVGFSGLAALSLCVCGTSAVAQDVLAPQPPVPTAPNVVQENQYNNPMQVFAPAPSAPGLPQIFQWGQLTLHPHLDYQFLYGSGIDSSPGHGQDSIVQTFAPGMLMKLGDHWSLDYTPTMKFYSASDLQNTLDHSVQLAWGMDYHNWALSASQNYVTTSDPIVETAAQTSEEIYTTIFNANYQISDKMSLALGLNQDFTEIGSGISTNNYLQSLASSRSWSSMDWLNYAIWPRLSFGLGVGFGYNQQDGSPDSINEQCQAQVKWRATDKISFQLGGGIQDQQYLTGGAGDLLTPIFSAAVQYQPFKHTQLSLSASRVISPSYFQGQDTETTVISTDLKQSLLGKLDLDLNGSYGSTRYVSTLFGLATSRSDDLYSVSVRLSYPFAKRGTVSVLYQYSTDSSTQSGFLSAGTGFGYTSRQIGFEIGYRY